MLNLERSEVKQWKLDFKRKNKFTFSLLSPSVLAMFFFVFKLTLGNQPSLQVENWVKRRKNGYFYFWCTLARSEFHTNKQLEDFILFYCYKWQCIINNPFLRQHTFLMFLSSRRIPHAAARAKMSGISGHVSASFSNQT